MENEIDTPIKIDPEDLASILRADEHILCKGNVQAGVADFWPIIASIGAIFLIALIPSQEARSIAILVLLPCSVVMQVIGMLTKRSKYFALSNQRLIVFARKGKQVTPIKSVELKDIQSVEPKGTSSVFVSLATRGGLSLSGDQGLVDLIRDAAKRKDDIS